MRHKKNQIYNVVKYILGAKGSMTAMKLQKLLYYCQAWSLVWDEAPLFPERIEAWANGPIVPDVYEKHKGMFEIPKNPNCFPDGKTSELESFQKKTIDSILDFYGDKTAHWLSELTHNEDPWKNARKGLKPGERGNAEISHAAMCEYYSSL